MVLHQLIFVATMTKVELSLIMELYKQITALQDKNIRLKDDIYELEAENRLLKTELLRSLRRSLDS